MFLFLRRGPGSCGEEMDRWTPRARHRSQLARFFARVATQRRNTRLPMLSTARQSGFRRTLSHFFLSATGDGCHPPGFWLGAAAISFFFFGFLVSRLLLRSPLAISISLGLQVMNG
ncbi:MAG: hypothetical protein WA702_04545 [Bradyrhizobium sp.]|jgi:hypothetical protein